MIIKNGHVEIPGNLVVNQRWPSVTTIIYRTTETNACLESYIV